jgi:hypothetical protein
MTKKPSASGKPQPKSPQPGPEAVPAPEKGGREGPEPTRYGDWEVKGICTDF